MEYAQVWRFQTNWATEIAIKGMLILANILAVINTIYQSKLLMSISTDEHALVG